MNQGRKKKDNEAVGEIGQRSEKTDLDPQYKLIADLNPNKQCHGHCQIIKAFRVRYATIGQIM